VQTAITGNSSQLHDKVTTALCHRFFYYINLLDPQLPQLANNYAVVSSFIWQYIF